MIVIRNIKINNLSSSETFKPVIGYEGSYEISNYGTVRSLARIVSDRNGKRYQTQSKTLRPTENRLGYLMVRLYHNTTLTKRDFSIHRLVAKCFCSNINGYEEVNHKNGIKSDNRWDNLEWCTRSMNMLHCTRVLKNNPGNKGNFNEKNGASKRVVQLTLEGEVVREYPSLSEAVRNGFDLGAIWSCCNGRNKKHKGFSWKYAS